MNRQIARDFVAIFLVCYSIIIETNSWLLLLICICIINVFITIMDHSIFADWILNVAVAKLIKKTLFFSLLKKRVDRPI